MTTLSPDLAAAVTLLADHLDAALAHAEDLRDVSQRLACLDRDASEAARRAHRQAGRSFVERVRRLESNLVGRTIAARERAQALAREEPMVATVARLFVAGTTPLVDALAAIADPAAEAFDTGDNVLAFLRKRAIVADDRLLEDTTLLEVGETYRVAESIELGPLMDLLAAFLYALDTRFDLYPATAESSVVPLAIVTRAEARSDRAAASQAAATNTSHIDTA